MLYQSFVSQESNIKDGSFWVWNVCRIIWSYGVYLCLSRLWGLSISDAILTLEIRDSEFFSKSYFTDRVLVVKLYLLLIFGILDTQDAFHGLQNVFFKIINSNGSWITTRLMLSNYIRGCIINLDQYNALIWFIHTMS